jgi:hypothetical protein
VERFASATIFTSSEVLLEAELGEDCPPVGAQDVIRRLAGVDGEQDGDQAAHDMGVAVALEAEHGSALGPALCLGCEPHLAGAAADLVSVRAVGLGQGRQAPAELDHVAVRSSQSSRSAKSERIISSVLSVILLPLVRERPG